MGSRARWVSSQSTMRSETSRVNAMCGVMWFPLPSSTRATPVECRMSPPRKKFGFWLATALVVGNIIGSAIFMLPAGLAAFGWNALAAWIITFVGALCLAWVFAELSRHLPDAGGSCGFMRLGVG